MSKETVEHDFFAMAEKENSCSKSQLRKLYNRQGSFRGIQNAISKINPELLKSMVDSGLMKCNLEKSSSVNHDLSLPSTPKGDQTVFPPLPLYNPIARSVTESGNEKSAMTIFYNGSVFAFDVSQEKAEAILKLAVEGSLTINSVDQDDNSPFAINRRKLLLLSRDLPMARRKSLETFLERRKERLTCQSQFGCHIKSMLLDQKIR